MSDPFEDDPFGDQGALALVEVNKIKRVMRSMHGELQEAVAGISTLQKTVSQMKSSLARMEGAVDVILKQSGGPSVNLISGGQVNQGNVTAEQKDE